MNSLVIESLNRLQKYCEAENFRGYDPYDGLNSRFFQSIPFVSSSRFFRLAWIQFFKRSPVNLRRITGIKKEYNPKGLGLFLAGYCNLYKQEPREEYKNKIIFLSGEILGLKNEGYSGACWGYNFDWQARAFFQPKNTPTVVASTFIANALLDAYSITKNEQLLQTARSTCDFILKDLNRTYDESGDFAFSYSPMDKSVVFNASLLGSRLLARVFSITKETALADEAKRSVNYCCKYQKEDGSWSYGTLPFHQWVDNFHTGYNLECVFEYMKFSGDNSYKRNVDQGLDYYINTFFTEEGIPRYYNNSTYPIDIHAPAQLVITLARLGKLEEHKVAADNVLTWTIRNMQAPGGFFYYQVNKYFSSRIPYIRWAQSWMFYALTTYIKFENNETD
ncbi:MAG TPA: hypothetical protein PKC54_04265 [Ferruginibacter sp.]|nr:hypothetical protein [Ferruginibacter sp.]